MNTIKVRPWGKDQGDYVLVNASDFDPAFHVPLDTAEVASEALEAGSDSSDTGEPAKRRGRPRKTAE